MDERDRQFMRKCLSLAQQAEGRTAPNPMVGAVVLDSHGVVVGEGFHKKAGTPHAEVHAFDQAGEAARGGTLYVNLEPCCHYGKTPPCSDRVIASGVKTVIVGDLDPNPLVASGGIKAMQNAGIEVRVGVLEEECVWLNRGFLKRVRTGLPWVCLKIAATLDGRIADRNGSSKWISSPESRQRVHELRNIFDGVLVGTNTLMVDDPELTVRKLPGGRDPVRIAIDSELRVRPDSRFCSVPTESATLLYAKRSAIAQRGVEYPDSVTLVAADAESSGFIDLEEVLKDLVATQRLNTVLAEGGGRIAASLLQNKLVDELYWIVAPKIIMDERAVSAISGLQEIKLSDCVYLSNLESTNCGDDLWIHALTR